MTIRLPIRRTFSMGALLAAYTFAAPALEARTIKLLTIGNSFADSVFTYLSNVAASAGESVIMNRANIGGCSLERHWNELKKSENDPSYKPYQKKYDLTELLTLDTWDIVTMQQASPLSYQSNSYQPWFSNIYSHVKRHAPQAEIVIQMTWSYRADHSLFSKGDVKDQHDMFERLAAAYTDIAREYNCRVIPTGVALERARAEQPVRFKLHHTQADLAALTYPALPPEPDGSFIKGHYWSKDKDGNWILLSDLIHLNKRGEYLQACVWFAALFGRRTADSTFIPPGISTDDARFLRDVAQQTADDFSAITQR